MSSLMQQWHVFGCNLSIGFALLHFQDDHLFEKLCLYATIHQGSIKIKKYECKSSFWDSGQSRVTKQGIFIKVKIYCHENQSECDDAPFTKVTWRMHRMLMWRKLPIKMAELIVSFWMTMKMRRMKTRLNMTKVLALFLRSPGSSRCNLYAQLRLSICTVE